MWLYNLLDIVATITEAAIFYVMTLCFCKTCRFQKVISRIIPPVVYAMAVIVMTFFVDIGAYRLFVLPALLIGLTLLCYEVPFHRALIVTELSYLFIIPFTESVGLSIINFIYHGDILTQVNGTAIIKWQIYVFIMLLRLLFLMVTYRLLKNFNYDILAKDAAIVSISFLLVFSVSFTSTYGYLNLRTSDTSFLDFITSVLCAVFIIQFLYSRNVSYLREQGQRDKMQIAQLQQQFAYYQEKMKDEERVRAIYHDLKNHLLVMESSQNTEETRHMAKTLRVQIADYEDYLHTGNEFLDIILKDKAAKSHEKQIDFSAMVDFHGIGFMESLDISTIFGNAIDNAIEASENLPEYKRLITVKAERVRDMLLITIKNNMSPGSHLTEQTTKKDRFLHGFGLPNIRKAVERYGGQCSIKTENGMFILKILIPIP